MAEHLVDTDGGPYALHHTLGSNANQAAPGNHTHDGGDSDTLAALKYSDIVGTPTIPPPYVPPAPAPVVVKYRGTINTPDIGSTAVLVAQATSAAPAGYSFMINFGYYAFSAAPPTKFEVRMYADAVLIKNYHVVCSDTGEAGGMSMFAHHSPTTATLYTVYIIRTMGTGVGLLYSTPTAPCEMTIQAVK